MGRSKSTAHAKVVPGSLEQKRTARSAEERLQSILELTADFYWERDDQHRFTLYRPSCAPDVEPETLVGKTSWETQQQAFLSEKLCDEMQGYYFCSAL